MTIWPTYAFALFAVLLFHFIVIKNVMGKGVHWLARIFIWALFAVMSYYLMMTLGKVFSA